MIHRPAPDTDRLRRINALLATALALPEAQRAAWLQALPAGQQALAPVLGALLARASVETDNFLRQPLQLGADALAALDATPDQPGSRVGPYRLISELGRGGMATVWLAERADGALQRQVALKLPHAGWGAGLAQRMAHERDMLAALAHPHIARLYDAGITDQGRPWLAMESVSGTPIDSHCSAHQLDVPARLRLFLQVADAVAHAHARLIVHRDLKPSNILVTPEGEVRLLDFGVGKLLQPEAAATSITQLMGRAVTPDYASPEQVAGRPVSVATDVYSLGVVLFELLTGARPYLLGRSGSELGRGSSELGRSSGALALEQAILAADVPPASQRVAGDKRLARQLRGDLDTILAKALRKDAARRYPSVEAMAADLRRHLDGEPVLARPPSRRYRAGKFMRRHRGALLAAALLFAAVLAGLAGTAWQARRADRLASLAQQQRDAALQQLAYAEAAESFMRFLLGEAADQPFTTATLLARADKVLDQQFAADPTLRARMQLLVAGLLYELDDFKQMAPVLQRAQASALASGQAGLMLEAECRLASLYVMTDRMVEAERLFARVMPRVMRELAADSSASLLCQAQRAVLYRSRQQFDAASADAQRVLRQIGRPSHARLTLYLQMQALLASVRMRSGQPAQAVAILTQALQQLDGAGLGRNPAAALLSNNLSAALWRGGQQAQALQALQRGMQASTIGGEVRDLALMTNYARQLQDSGQGTQALAWFQKALQAGRQRGDLQVQNYSLWGLAAAHCAQQQWADCDQQIQQLRGRLRALQQAQPSDLVGLELLAADSWLARGAPAQARQVLLQARAIQAGAQAGTTRLAQAFVAWRLARALALLGEHGAAQAEAAAAVAAAREATTGFAHSDWVGRALLAQAVVQRAAGDASAARPSAAQALAHLEAAAAASAPALLEARALVAALR